MGFHRIHSRFLCLRARAVVACTLLSGISSWALADAVYLKNGDKISGEILTLDANSLRIKPNYSPEITIERSAIQSLETSEKRRWLMNRAVQEVVIIASDKDSMVLVDNQPVSLSELNYPVGDKDSAWRYTGSVEAAIDGTKNSRETQKLRTKTDLSAQSLHWRHTLKAEIHYELEDDVIKRNTLQGQYSLDYLVDDHWFVRQEDLYQQNRVGMDSKSYYVALGPGYRLWGADRDKLDFVVTYNRFDMRVGHFDYHFYAWAATVNYKQYWFDGLLETFTDYQIAFLDIPGVDYLADASFGLKYLLTSYMYLSFKYDFSESRGAGIHERDVSYGLGLGVNF